MALQSETGKYLKIDNVRFDENYVADIGYSIYISKEHRDNRNSPEWEDFPIKQGGINSGLLQTELLKKADASLSLVDNLKKAGYIAIKGDTFEISSWSDV
jgi:hypothetical protein